MADTEPTPISPVDAVKNPEISISAAAVNNEPVELDSTPTSLEEQRRRRGSKEDVSPEDQEKRKQLIQERKGDAAVLADIPQTPGAEEFSKSEDAEGKVGGEREVAKKS